jgi:hypothetical protein
VTRTAAREVLLDFLVRSISDLRHFVGLLDGAGYAGLAAALRQRQAERPAITGVPKLDPSVWRRGPLQ